ncbi:hypothetical protein D320_09899 [Haloferax sp. BAB-2207]|nr:hypothetical protein D320_09899 [Haloferax sp. BAB-2207]
MIVIDLFGRNRRLRGDIIWKVLGPFFELTFRLIFFDTSLALLVFDQLFGIPGNLSKTIRWGDSSAASVVRRTSAAASY